jgi:hypothetical protein
MAKYAILMRKTEDDVWERLLSFADPHDAARVFLIATSRSGDGQLWADDVPLVCDIAHDLAAGCAFERQDIKGHFGLVVDEGSPAMPADAYEVLR